MLNHDSDLKRALRRVGSQLGELTDVEGLFVAEERQSHADRCYGTLIAVDASIAIGFDAKRVPLPPSPRCVVSVSGKVWLDDTSGVGTVMVRHYRVISPAADAGGLSADCQGPSMPRSFEPSRY